jgi:hypothetical protein
MRALRMSFYALLCELGGGLRAGMRVQQRTATPSKFAVQM